MEWVSNLDVQSARFSEQQDKGRQNHLHADPDFGGSVPTFTYAKGRTVLKDRADWFYSLYPLWSHCLSSRWA